MSPDRLIEPRFRFLDPMLALPVIVGGVGPRDSGEDQRSAQAGGRSESG